MLGLTSPKLSLDSSHMTLSFCEGSRKKKTNLYHDIWKSSLEVGIPFLMLHFSILLGENLSMGKPVNIPSNWGTVCAGFAAPGKHPWQQPEFCPFILRITCPVKNKDQLARSIPAPTHTCSTFVLSWLQGFLLIAHIHPKLMPISWERGSWKVWPQ